MFGTLDDKKIAEEEDGDVIVTETTVECAISKSFLEHTGGPETCPKPQPLGKRRSTCPIKDCEGKSEHLIQQVITFYFPPLFTQAAS